MGWTSKSYSFTLMTDAHAGEQEAIDDAIADGFLKEIEKLANKINKYRSREIVFLGWEREETMPEEEVELPAIEVFGWGNPNCGSYEWDEVRIYKHPLVSRRFVVDNQSGCSCNYYEALTGNELASCQPMTKAEARKELIEWADRFKEDHSQEFAHMLEVFNSEVK